MGTRTLLVVLAVLVVLAPHSAWAYLDPGSGSMLLQILLGGVAGLVVLAKLYWQRLLEWLGLSKAEVTHEAPPDPDEPESGGH